MPKLSLLGSRGTGRYILIVGDDGAILLYFNNGKLDGRLFAASPTAAEIQNFHKLLNKAPNAPISIMLDVIDQSYLKQSLPAVSSFSIGNLVKKRLKRDYAETDIKGAIMLGREKTGRRDWNYLFVSSPLAPPFSEWLEFTSALPNRLEGIYMLPVEMELLIKDLVKHYLPKQDKINTASAWQLFVSHNKTSGFRQVVLKDGKMIFTRLVQTGSDLLPDVIAGNIEQEVLNTVEYLRRLSFDEADGLDVFLLTARDIKQSLTTSNLYGKNIFLLTPFDVAEKLHLSNAALEGDKFADTILAAHFSRQRKHILQLHTATSQKNSYFQNAEKASFFATAFAAPVLLAYSGYLSLDMISMQKDISFSKKEKAALQQRLEATEKGPFEQFKSELKDKNDADRISESVKIYQELSTSRVSPLSVISEFAAIKGTNVLVTKLQWEIAKPEAGVEVDPSMAPPPPVGPDGEPLLAPPSIKVEISVDLFNIGKNFEDLLAAFNIFVQNLEKHLSHYDVKYSQPPNDLSFSDNFDKIPIEITITGPKPALPEGKPLNNVEFMMQGG